MAKRHCSIVGSKSNSDKMQLRWLLIHSTSDPPKAIYTHYDFDNIDIGKQIKNRIMLIFSYKRYSSIF